MESFRDMLSSTDWIDPQTKVLALDKVQAMMLRIGYPDFILDQIELDERYRDVSNTIQMKGHVRVCLRS